MLTHSRNYILNCLMLALMLAFSTASGSPKKIFPTPTHDAVTLVEKGQSQAVIIIPDEGRKYQRMPAIYYDQKDYARFYDLGVNRIAAEELQTFIQKITGAKLPIIVGKPSDAKKRPAILLGFGDASGIPPEGFRIRTLPQAVMITPSQAKPQSHWKHDGLYAIIFAADDFLERLCGVRFYYPGEEGTVIPSSPTLTIPPIDYMDYPTFSHRLLGGPWDANHGGNFTKVPNLTLHKLRWRVGCHGRTGSERNHCHTPDLFKYGKLKREIGKPTTPPLPCFNDQATVDAFINYAKSYRYDIVPFSPPDHPIHCQCPACKAKWNPNSFNGQASRTYGDFLANVFQRMKHEVPHKSLFLLPYYNYADFPQGLALPKETIVEVCLLASHPMWHDKTVRNTNMKLLQDWSAALGGQKVRIWTYPMWPTFQAPLPTFYYRNLKRFVHDISPYVSGAFVESIRSWHREFPTQYCQMKLLWDPDFNPDQALDDMCQRLYGPAAVPMRDLFRRLNSVYESINSDNTPSIMDFGYYQAGHVSKKHLYSRILKEEEVKTWQGLVRQARELTTNQSLQRKRVDFFARSMDIFFIDYHAYAKPWIPGTLMVERVDSLPLIDGKKTDRQWMSAKAQSFVNAQADYTTTPEHQTHIRAVHDGKAIAFLLEMDEPQLDDVKLAQNVWSGDSMELLFEYLPGSIYHLMLDSAGNVADNSSGPHKLTRTEFPTWKAGRSPHGWLLEINLPFNALNQGTDYTKTPLRANFIRNRHIKGKDSQHSRWQTRFNPSNFDLTAFGLLKCTP